MVDRKGGQKGLTEREGLRGRDRKSERERLLDRYWHINGLCNCRIVISLMKYVHRYSCSPSYHRV